MVNFLFTELLPFTNRRIHLCSLLNFQLLSATHTIYQREGIICLPLPLKRNLRLHGLDVGKICTEEKSDKLWGRCKVRKKNIIAGPVFHFRCACFSRSHFVGESMRDSFRLGQNYAECIIMQCAKLCRVRNYV